MEDEKERKKLLKDDDLYESGSSDDEKQFLNNEEEDERKKKNNKGNKDEERNVYEDSLNNNVDSINKEPEISKEDLHKAATSKSLNIGSDYSKYLLSLNLDSAYYDPKSRSMRENPLPGMDDKAFKGENHVRLSGDTSKFREIEGFISQANDKNRELNV